MKAQTALHITVPKPCAQDWAAMTNAGRGKHCAGCNNIVHDFTQMTDDELLNFFKLQPSTHCGRFLQSQLGRNILPVVVKKKLFLNRFNKIAAAFFAVLSFKSMASNAGFKNLKQQTVFSPNFIKKSLNGLDKIIISGTIKDAAGKPLEKAKIIFDTTAMAFTDKDGNFSFELDGATAITHHLYFSYEDLISVVRTYHPAMASASYDVVLNKKGEGFHKMGAPSVTSLDLPSLVFKLNTAKLYGEHKKILAFVANELKQNPTVNIEIWAYPPICGKQYIQSDRVENVKKYLVEAQGISSDRIKTNCEIDGGDKSTIDFRIDQ